MTDPTKDAFIAAVSRPEAEISLAQAALQFAAHLAGPVDVAHYRSLLADMAGEVGPTVLAAADDAGRIAALNTYLFAVLQFTGNRDDYYAAGNSFLNQVIDHRRGIPISLSVIYLEIGWALGLPVFGVGMPGHFIVGYELPDSQTYIDVFNQGRRLTEADCLEICQLPLSDLIPFRRDYLKPAAKRAILYRMLLNLKQIFLKSQDWPAAYKTVDLMLQLYPEQVGDIRDRGLLAYRLNRLRDAIFDLERYLNLAPQARDAAWLRDHLDTIRSRLIRLN